jgi:CheY-like chemotaxis protein
MRVLVVDDDPGALNAIKVGLMSLGYEVFTASDGEDALRIIQSSEKNHEPPDLLLTDFRMPGMTGLELIKSAREFIPGIKIILMTAYGDDHIQNQTKKLGKCGYIDKPFSPRILIRMIEGKESN